jgi:hypothetical protein
MNPMFSQQIVAGNVSPVVVDWINRIIKNGGTKPSQNTISAVNRFYHNIDSTTIIGKIKSLNCYVPDNLIACLTPLINTYGNDPWTNYNNNFVAGDLTINGLIGNGGAYYLTTTKYLDTGVLGTNYLNDNTAGLTVYAYTSGLNAGGDGGTYDAGYTNWDGTDGDALSFHRSNGNTFGFWAYNINDGTCLFSSTNTGYLSGNRISISDERMYFANSSNTHAQVGNTVTSGTGTRGAHNIYVHAGYLWSNSPIGPDPFGASTSRISFAAVHDGLTASESSQFFNFIQAYRQQIGGGWT